MINPRKTNITENRLIILYMLQKIGVDIFEDVFSGLMMEYEWMTYFEMRECLLSLTENDYIQTKESDATRKYSITGEGHSVLELFKKRIPLSIRTIIDEFAGKQKENNEHIASIYADYSQDSDLEFPVKLRIEEYGTRIFSLNIVAPSALHAKRICDNFEQNGIKIYGEVLKKLTTEPKD